MEHEMETTYYNGLYLGYIVARVSSQPANTLGGPSNRHMQEYPKVTVLRWQPLSGSQLLFVD